MVKFDTVVLVDCVCMSIFILFKVAKKVPLKCSTVFLVLVVSSYCSIARRVSVLQQFYDLNNAPTLTSKVMPGSSGDSASLVEPMRDKFFGQWSSSSVTNHFPVWGGGGGS